MSRVDFDGLALGTEYHVTETFEESGVRFAARLFQWSDGRWTDGGRVRVEDRGRAGGSGRELGVGNINLAPIFEAPCEKLSVLFGEYGGNLNIEINGEFKNFDNFVDIHETLIGGVKVVVAGDLEEGKGVLQLDGVVNSFAIGGQEFWIDDVEFELVSIRPEVCVEFEKIKPGIDYRVGDTFIDPISNVPLAIRPFQWSTGGWTADGYARIGSGGHAGGSGQELLVNNVNVAVIFGGPLKALSLCFGEYGGNLNIEINGGFRNFEDFVEIDGTIIGGVKVSVSNGLGHDKGMLMLEGRINSFAVGGQELCIDNICPFIP